MSSITTLKKNVLGEVLSQCGCEPMTGYFRDGYCHISEEDHGNHSVCAVMTEEFLAYTKVKGNDLSTPRPEWGFPGLKPGDHWCLCASRWLEAYEDGCAPKVHLKACSEDALGTVPLAALKEASTFE